MIDGSESSAQSMVQQEYSKCLQSMHSNFQFTLETNFESRQKEMPKNDRHAQFIKEASEWGFARTDVFIDCAGSKDRRVFSNGAVPCLTASHAIYSLQLERYLNGVDLLNCQGLWKSAFSENMYKTMLSRPTFAHDLAGNSFSSTVCQAVVMASFCACPCAWLSLQPEEGEDLKCQEVQAQEQPSTLLRRIRKKQHVGDFVVALTSEQKMRKRCRKYKRKEPGIDSRKITGEKKAGKKTTLSIWHKEEVFLGSIRSRFDCITHTHGILP